MFVTIVAFVLVLALLIFAHEMGHFIAARLAGVKVEEFGIGFPPRLVSFKRGETVYSLNLVPLGGFCKLLGEEDPSEPKSLASKRPLIRLAVLGAGPLMNAVIPILLLSVAFMIPRQVVVGDVLVEAVAPNSPAAEAGIEPGDTIVGINGSPVQNTGDLIYDTHLSLGEVTTIELAAEDGTQKVVTLIPRWEFPEGEGPVGVQITMVNVSEMSVSDPFWRAVPKSATTLWETFELIRNEVRGWFIRGSAPQVTGPVGIFQLTGEASEAGPSYLLQFAAFLSLNLAIINLFPIPALDGGRIVFVLLEMVRRGKRISARREGLVHLIGFVMIISLMLAITYYDIVRVITGESLVP